uniref:hypothetical protein n=1 Tax=Flavobacterium sp. TaxID=239 RepID=UPI00404A2838
MAKTKTYSHNLRISELIENGFSDSEIVHLIKKEHRIHCSVDQIKSKRAGNFIESTKSDIETQTNIEIEKIQHIFQLDNCRPKSRKEIRKIYFDIYGLKLSDDEFTRIVWGELKSKFTHCRTTWSYQWNEKPTVQNDKINIELELIKGELSDFNPFETLNNQARKNFIKVNSGNKRIDELIKTVVKDNKITECEEEFLKQKTAELGLPISVLEEAKRSLHENNPYLDNLLHLVFEDGIVTNQELLFLKEKVIENKYNPVFFNVRFWQIGLLHYMDYLLKYEPFVNIVKFWGVNYKLKIDSNLGDKFYYNSLNIFESTNFKDLLVNGEIMIKNRLNNSLKTNNSTFNIEDTLYLIKTPSFINIEANLNAQPLNAHIDLLKTI